MSESVVLVFVVLVFVVLVSVSLLLVSFEESCNPLCLFPAAGVKFP